MELTSLRMNTALICDSNRLTNTPINLFASWREVTRPCCFLFPVCDIQALLLSISCLWNPALLAVYKALKLVKPREAWQYLNSFGLNINLLSFKFWFKWQKSNQRRYFDTSVKKERCPHVSQKLYLNFKNLGMVFFFTNPLKSEIYMNYIFNILYSCKMLDKIRQRKPKYDKLCL